MKNLNELTKKDLIVVNGGDSFAFRVGQALAIIFALTFDGTPGRIDTVGGAVAFYNWTR
ncbi:MAG: hypothetical protein NTZ69_13290 [Bacteroidia bacterium]|nr:hypothetical protein [Bacteroidia bacterium]